MQWFTNAVAWLQSIDRATWDWVVLWVVWGWIAFMLGAIYQAGRARKQAEALVGEAWKDKMWETQVRLQAELFQSQGHQGSQGCQGHNPESPQCFCD